jgi:hypothetical protein
LMTAMDAMPSPNSPGMANEVVVEVPPMPTQPEVLPVATQPGAAERTTVTATADDLSSLRQRLAEERFTLPTLRVETRPRHRKSRVIPLLQGEF